MSTHLLQQSIAMRRNGTTTSTVISQSLVSVKFFLVNSVSLMTCSYGANSMFIRKGPFRLWVTKYLQHLLDEK